eukprot:jgi/Picsp_1/1875/NSC_05341-R1_---NA---
MDGDMYETGSSVYMKVFFPEIDVLTFDNLKPQLRENIQAFAMGAKYTPHIRDYDIQEALDDDGLLVSIMVDFSQDDGTPASLLTSKVTQEPTSIFPQEAFGPVEVHVVSQIVCIFSCGLHGYRMPKIAESGQVSCTCECDLGWETDMDQSFDFFEYCAVQHETQSVPGPEGPLDSTLESTGM